MDPNSRLRLATRIHFALLRHFNEDVDIRTLLKDGSDAQEALWVCEASGNRELMTLAREFRQAARHELRSARRHPAPWVGTAPSPTTANAGPASTDNTPSSEPSGVSRPPAHPAAPAEAPTGSPAWTLPPRRNRPR